MIKNFHPFCIRETTQIVFIFRKEQRKTKQERRQSKISKILLTNAFFPDATYSHSPFAAATLTYHSPVATLTHNSLLTTHTHSPLATVTSHSPLAILTRVPVRYSHSPLSRVPFLLSLVTLPSLLTQLSSRYFLSNSPLAILAPHYLSLLNSAPAVFGTVIAFLHMPFLFPPTPHSTLSYRLLASSFLFSLFYLLSDLASLLLASLFPNFSSLLSHSSSLLQISPFSLLSSFLHFPIFCLIPSQPAYFLLFQSLTDMQ